MFIGTFFRVARWLASLVLGALIMGSALIGVLWWTSPDPASEPDPSWSRHSDMLRRRGELAAGVVGDELIIIGGLEGWSTTDAVAVWSDDSWSSAPDLPAPRHHAAAAGFGRHVYVTGGAAGTVDWTPTTQVWRAVPGQPWRDVEPMPEGRQGHDMVALDGRLYVVGGVGPTDRTLIYDPDRGWSKGAPLPFGRDHLKAVAWRGSVWALGGRAGGPMDRVDIYDPEADRWRDGPPLPEAMSAMAVGALDDGLHVLGGEDPGLIGGRVMSGHYVLDAPGGEWTEAPGAILAVHGAASGVIDRRMYVAGGASRQGALSAISFAAVLQSYAPLPEDLEQRDAGGD